ncbi:hypothetical protein D3C77_750610 [compost metagenome]
MRSAVWRSSFGSIALSWVAMMAQLGLVFQAAWLTLALKICMLIGTCESRRKAASALVVSPANPILNFSRLTKP